MPPSEPAAIARLAEELRQRIYRGEWGPGAQVPTRAQLSERYGISPESAGVVLRMLAREGLVTLRQGAGTFVEPRRLYRVEAEVPWVAAVSRGGDLARFAEAAGAAWRGDPALSDGDMRAHPGAGGVAAVFGVTVDLPAGRQGAAVERVLSVLRGAALAAGGVLDVASAAVRVWPVPGAAPGGGPAAAPGTSSSGPC